MYRNGEFTKRVQPCTMAGEDTFIVAMVKMLVLCAVTQVRFTS